MRTATGKEDPELPLLQSSLELTAPQITAQINSSQSSSNRLISTSTVQRLSESGIHLKHFFFTIILSGKLTENTFSFTATTWGIVTGERRGMNEPIVNWGLLGDRDGFEGQIGNLARTPGITPILLR
jgi:hypothetical protein